jgi:hypothetical protein
MNWSGKWYWSGTVLAAGENWGGRGTEAAGVLKAGGMRAGGMRAGGMRAGVLRAGGMSAGGARGMGAGGLALRRNCSVSGNPASIPCSQVGARGTGGRRGGVGAGGGSDTG